MENNFLKNLIKEFIAFTVPKGSSFIIVNNDNYAGFISGHKKQYDYIIFVNILEKEKDIQKLLETIYTRLYPEGKLIIIYKNYLYSFITEFFLALFSQQKSPRNWLSTYDLRMFLNLANYDYILSQPLCFMSAEIPIISTILNKIILYLFPFNHLSFLHYMTARKIDTTIHDTSVSIIIPARNEAGTIDYIFNELPPLGSGCEVIFIHGHSSDDTQKQIELGIKKYKSRLPFTFRLIDQGDTYGKASAVRLGFAKAHGDILIIYDADRAVKATDLTKFYLALITHKGNFINGSRLVYPMEGKAMQFLNIFGNKIFSLIYSWLLGQTIKDTLCGTKALWRKDYQKINKYDFYGKIDPFGDFELLLGANRLNLKIIDLPVRYFERTYGSTNIKRFKNAWQLFKFSLIGFRKLKMRLP